MNVNPAHRNLTWNQLYGKFLFAVSGRKFAWAKYYELVNQTHDRDYAHYQALTQTVAVEAIPTHIKTELKEMSAALKKKWECPICLEFIPDGSVEVTNCGHFYCKPCLTQLKQTSRQQGEDKWSCAVCRKKHTHGAEE